MNVAHVTLPAMLVLAALATGCDNGSSAATRSAEPSEAVISAPSDAAPASTAPAASELAPDSTGIIETTFDDVKFPMEKTDDFAESMLTDRVKSLFDKRIRIRGYIYPTPRRNGLKKFVLVRDNLECCFGPGAALFDCILVSMAGGATAEYTIRPVAVEGRFRLEPLPGQDGRPLAIYQMDGEAVN
jgi:hypothetical protein